MRLPVRYGLFLLVACESSPSLEQAKPAVAPTLAADGDARPTSACSAASASVVTPAAEPALPTGTGTGSGWLLASLDSQDVYTGSVDLDGDGHAEPLRLQLSAGSGYGSWTLTLTAMEGQPALELGGSFGSLVSVAAIPGALAARPALLRGVLGAMVVPAIEVLAMRSPTVEPSLGWLLDLYGKPALAPRPPFSRVHGYTPRWISGRPTPPRDQELLLDQPSQLGLARAVARVSLPSGAFSDQEERAFGHLVPGQPFGLLSYGVHSHGELRELPGCDGWVLHATHHALAVEELATRSWTWAYVSNDVTKLRWASLGAVRCGGGLVALERESPDMHELVVVDPRVGRFGAIEVERGVTWEFTTDGTLRFGSDSYDAATLRCALATG